jgi:hypothetical protein
MQIPTVEPIVQPPCNVPKRGRRRPGKPEAEHGEKIPGSKSKLKINKDRVILERRIDEEKERIKMARELLEENEANPIKLDKYK